MNPSGGFWCHLCRSTVTLPPGSDMLCPNCSEGFLEQMEGPTPGIGLDLLRALFLAGYPAANDSDPWRTAASPSRRDTTNRRFLRRMSPDQTSRPSAFQLLELMSILSSSPALRESDPHLSIEMRRDRDHMRDMSRLHSVLSRRGVIEDDETHRGGERALNAGEFVFGTGLDAFLQHLAERDGARHGSAPASRTAVEAMPVRKFTNKGSESDDIHCAVCKEAFVAGGEVREMPCKHIYHSECILPWLALHSSCPICRHEMPAEASPQSNSLMFERTTRPWRVMAENEEHSGGEFGLAILGDMGFGVHVRHITVFPSSHRRYNPNPESEPAVLDSVSADAGRLSPVLVSSGAVDDSQSTPQRDLSDLQAAAHAIDDGSLTGRYRDNHSRRYNFFSRIFRHRSSSPRSQGHLSAQSGRGCWF